MEIWRSGLANMDSLPLGAEGHPAIYKFSLETLRVNGHFCGVTRKKTRMPILKPGSQIYLMKTGAGVTIFQSRVSVTPNRTHKPEPKALAQHQSENPICVTIHFRYLRNEAPWSANP
jgi:hypothetical protein